MDTNAIASLTRPTGLPFSLNKIGHVALFVTDLERSARFYVEVLGFRVTDVYGDDMMPGGAVFLRCNTDHHGIALFPATQDKLAGAGLHHMAFEVGSLDQVVRARNHLRALMFRSASTDAAEPVCRLRWSSAIRTGIRSKSTGASTRSAPTDAPVRRISGKGPAAWKPRSPTR